VSRSRALKYWSIAALRRCSAPRGTAMFAAVQFSLAMAVPLAQASIPALGGVRTWFAEDATMRALRTSVACSRSYPAGGRTEARARAQAPWEFPVLM
jgi:hypothetical protein